MAEFLSPRRYYLYKSRDAADRGDGAISSLYHGKQEGEPGTALPDDFPSREALAAYRYKTKEDLEGADVDELVLNAKLSRKDAEKVLAAHAAL